MIMDIAKQRTKQLGILWVISFVIIGIVLEIWAAIDNTAAFEFIPENTIAAALFTVPHIASWIITLVYFYPLLIAIHYYAKQAKMGKVSVVSLSGIILISIWLACITVLIIVAVLQL